MREIVEGDVEESKGSQKSRSVGLGKIHGDPEIVAQRLAVYHSVKRLN